MNKAKIFLTSILVYLTFIIWSNKAIAQNYKNSIIDEYFYSSIPMMYNDSIEESWNLLKFCELTDSTDAPIFYALAENEAMSKNNDGYFHYLEKAYKISPLNELYAIPYADILQQNGNSSKAIEVINALIKKDPSNYNYKEKIAFIYLYSGEIKKAINIYDELQKQSQNVPSDYERYSIAKMRIYKAVGDQDNFIKELENLSKKYPNNKEYIYSLLNEMIKDKKYKEKANNIISYLEKDPETKDAGLFFKTVVNIGDHHFDIAKKNLTDFINLPTASKIKKIELLNYITSTLSELSDTTKIENISLPIFKKLINEDKKDTKLLLQYASALKSIGMSDSALMVVKKAIDISPKDPYIYDISSKLFLDNKDIDKCAYISKKATDNNIYKLEYILWQTAPNFDKQNKESETIKTILSYLNKKDWSKEDKSVLLGVVGDLYSSKKDTINAIKYYEEALKSFEDNANVANNYSYLLTESNKNLEKAEALGALAVRLNPNDPNNLDTYAWALYKNKQYTLARIHISKALDNDNKENPSFTLLIHACYIYLALNDKEKALEYYKKVKEFLKNNPQDKDIEMLKELENLLNKKIR